MPRLYGYRVVKFVSYDWNGEHDVVAPDKIDRWEEIDDSLAVEAYAEHLDRWVIRCRDQARLCAELGHEHHVGGCRHYHADRGMWQCEFSLMRALESCRTPERPRAVRIHIKCA
jgi:hypothetical protein